MNRKILTAFMTFNISAESQDKSDGTLLNQSVSFKGKGTQNINGFCLKVFGKLHIFMQTAWKSDSYFLRYCDIFKIAASGGRLFEINIKTENY